MKRLNKILLASLATLSLAGGLTGCDLFKKSEQGSDSGDTTPTGTVVSVSVTSPVTSVVIGHDPVQLSVEVETTGNASKTVAWTTSNGKIAKVSSTGRVTFVGGGTVTITATSTFDGSKKGSVSITVDAGFRPELIESGYMYTKSFPASIAKSFVGKDVAGFEAEEGFYYKQFAATTDSAAYLQIVTADTDDNYDAFVDAIEQTDYFYFYDSENYLHCFLDQAQTFELDFDEYYLLEDDDDYSIILTLYKVADIWYSSTPTTDTAWDATTAGYIAGYGVDVPFIKLGEEYDSYYDEDEDWLIIYDGCADFNKLNNYEASLLENEWTKKGSEEDGYYYEKVSGDYTTAVIQFYFGYYGNCIEVTTGLRELADYPATEVNTFISSFSVKTMPAYEWPEDATFTYAKTEEDGTEYVGVGVYGVDEDELTNFVATLVADGFEIVPDSAVDHYYGTSYVSLQKGKIVVQAVIIYESHEATEADIAAMLATLEKYADVTTEEAYDALTPEQQAEFDEAYDQYIEYAWTGTFEIYDYDTVAYGGVTIYADEEAHEVPGLYVDSDNVKVSVGGTLSLDVEAFELGEDPTIEYALSAEGVVTIDEDGVVTGVVEGTVVVTATVDYNETIYALEITVNVVNEVTDTLTLEKLHPGKTIGTVYTAFSNISDASDAKYSGTCAGGNSSIQIRSKNSDSGIYSSTSGGNIKSVSVEFNEADTNTSAIKVVASNEPFTSVGSLHSATVVGEITSASPTYEFTADYAYVGVISANGAHYLDSVSFVWGA